MVGVDDGVNMKADRVYEPEFYLVGIGASAGGLEALERFFRKMDKQDSIAFVVIQHLSPDYKSMLVELLSKHAQMPVHQAENEMAVLPGHVYVIPPKRGMTISEGTLKLREVPQGRPHLPIDIFFDSMANDMGDKSVAVVLSGTGSDGSQGIRAVKEAGGMVMVQDRESAKFDGMPRSAIATGMADYVIPPDEMPGELVSYCASGRVFSSPAILTDEETLSKIYYLIRRQGGGDFSYYKINTIIRRIQRRMMIHKVDTMGEYLAYLERNPDEVSVLNKEFLIGVTKFFRDGEFFENVRVRVIPQLVNDKLPGSQIRVWVSGCFTGEEAYTLAILFKEHMDAIKKYYEVKIFATDVDKDAIDFAARGVYPENIASDVSAERLEHHFVKKGDTYHVTKEVRKMVIFARHDIIQDPPFYKMDLISCRNLLIYFQPVLQKKLIALFHQSLNNGGYLLLGNSESVTGDYEDVFQPLTPRLKIYEHKAASKRLHYSDVPFMLNLGTQDGAKPIAVAQASRENDVYTALLDMFVPDSIVVSEKNEILHIFGEASKFLRVVTGRATWELLKMVHPDLRSPLTTALHKARNDRVPVSYSGVSMRFGDDVKNITLSVKPLSIGQRNHYIVLFEEQSLPSIVGDQEEHYDLEKSSAQYILGLESSLSRSQESLQAIVEEFETTNEELQATNEELLTANEELQSTNEELQSLNEELYTVNAEYEKKLEEVIELNNDINNYLSASNVGTIFLDTDLSIVKFSRYIASEINLIEGDIGRPIAHLSHNLHYEGLVEDAKRVLETEVAIEREVRSKNGKHYSLRISAYRTTDDLVKGVVVGLIDISELKAAYEQIETLSYAIEQMPNVVVICDLKGQIRYVNPRFVQLTGYSAQEVVGKNVLSLEGYKMSADDAKLNWGMFLQGNSWHGEILSITKDGREFWERAIILPVMNKDGTVGSILKLAEDVTEQKLAEDQMRHMAFHDILTGLPNRALFEDRLKYATAHARRRDKMVAVLFMDLDNFKVINDNLGHGAGDLILKAISSRIQALTREEDTFARFGGDEFMLLLPEIRERDEAVRVAEKIIAATESPVVVDDKEFHISTSIGIVIFPTDGTEPETLIKNADIAMYQAKEKGRNTYQVFTPAMNTRITRRLSIENGLRSAIDRGELSLNYQPLVGLKSGKILSVEALARWFSPDLGQVPPDEFIPVSEDSGMIFRLGEWVLSSACRQAKRWQRMGFEDLAVSVNLSSRQFLQPNFKQVVQDILRESGLSPRSLVLEITEGSAMQNLSYTLGILRDLKDLGIRIALDDFGTGYSSLNYLQRLPIDILKIDKAFVNKLESDPGSQAVVAATMAMAEKLGFCVVAEGVENQRQLDSLRDFGCDVIQGYHICYPVPADKLTITLRENQGYFSR
jgi:two-component system CheB/CheR fusion protein